MKERQLRDFEKLSFKGRFPSGKPEPLMEKQKC